MLGFLVAYAWGSLLAGLLLGRYLFGDDVRHKDNHGASGSWRQYGPFIGIAVALLDLLKGAIAVLIAQQLPLSDLQLVLVVAGVIAGHNWPLWFGFRGGGGLATVTGALAILAPGQITLGLAVTLGIAMLYRISPLRQRFALAALPAGACVGIPFFLGLTWWGGNKIAALATLVAGLLIGLRGLQMLSQRPR